MSDLIGESKMDKGLLALLKDISVTIGQIPADNYSDLYKLLHRVDIAIVRANPHEVTSAWAGVCTDCQLPERDPIHDEGETTYD